MFRFIFQVISIAAVLLYSTEARAEGQVWLGGKDQRPAFSRAVYSGKVKDDAVFWTGELSVELFSDRVEDMKIMPQSVTLSDVQLDGKPAALFPGEGNSFSAHISGRGVHNISVEFQTPIIKNSGPSQTRLQIPLVPVNKITLTLPGKKEVTVGPQATVDRIENKDSTVATIYTPMTDNLSVQWTEAVPEEIKSELRVDASLYSSAFAEDGLLTGRATVDVDITRGEAGLIEFDAPKDIQVNSVTSPQGFVSDWRLQPAEGDKPALLTVYFDRSAKGSFQLNIGYDHAISAKEKNQPLPVPVLRARSAHRQRGIVMLLASKELTLQPSEDSDAVKIGENQIPAEIHQALGKSVTQSYKYSDTPPRLLVSLTKPIKQQGKFDATVNTLASVGDASLRGATSVDVHVKTGAISELDVTIPANVHLLSVSAPSMRDYTSNTTATRQTVHFNFTQDMEGDFRVELAYEQITADSDSELTSPAAHVPGSDVEQGQIAVEALSALEVLPANVERLSSIDPAELPKQLVLKTTNPILLAYKYTQSDVSYSLSFSVKRHKELDLQTAAIDSAAYRTFITMDGLSVTAAHLTVRNSREQFLRLTLPPSSRLWSVQVDGKAEKPAIADGESSGVLIKIINSTAGFPVDFVYQTESAPFGKFGAFRMQLPRPEMIVAASSWDIYAPEELALARPDTNMKLVESGQRINREVLEYEARSMSEQLAGNKVSSPIQIGIPAAGVHYRFEKFYANQAAEGAYIAAAYSRGWGTWVTQLTEVLCTALCFLFGSAYYRSRSARELITSIAAGAGLGILIGYIGFGFRPALFTGAACFLCELAANLPKSRLDFAAKMRARLAPENE